jgi:GH18 family chitinase
VTKSFVRYVSSPRFVALVACSAPVAVAIPTAVGQGVEVRFKVDSAWNDGYNGSIELENTGSEAIDGWTLSYLDGPEMTSAWNADWAVEGDRSTFMNLDWNGLIQPGSLRVIGFEGVGSLEENVREATFNGAPIEVQYEGAGGGDGGDGDGGDGDDGSDDGNDGDGGGGSPPTPDFNGDGLVDGADLSILLSAWGGDVPELDIDGNGSIDGADLAGLLAAWGPIDTGGGGGPDTDKKIVAYYIEWGIYGRDYQPADMPLEKITHVNYAFANIGEDGRIAIGDPYAAVEKLYPGDAWDQPYAGTYNQLNNVLRAEFPHIRTLISVGGWTWSGRFSDVALTNTSRAVFAESCVDFIRSYNFDGVDIDWEYPGGGGLPSNVSRPEDRENYTLLLQELRDRLDAAGAEDGREYLLTIASGAGWDKIDNLEVEAISDILDWINVMTYDFRGAWDFSSTAHHAGMYENPDDPVDGDDVAARYNVDSAIQTFLARGAAPGKIVVGVPFYSRSWGGVQDPLGNGGLFQPATSVPPGTWDDWSSGATGINDFFEIEEMIASGDYVRYWDGISQVPYLYSPTRHDGHFVSYDDEESMGIKMDYIIENELGGAMFWEVTADRNETLMDVIIDGLKQSVP